MLQFIFRGLDDVRLQCILGYSPHIPVAEATFAENLNHPVFSVFVPPHLHPMGGITARSRERGRCDVAANHLNSVVVL